MIKWLILLSAIVLSGCSQAYWSYEAWKMDQENKCAAMGGRYNYVGEYRIQCYRTIIFLREPKLLFESTYIGMQ